MQLYTSYVGINIVLKQTGEANLAKWAHFYFLWKAKQTLSNHKREAHNELVMVFLLYTGGKCL